MKIAKRNKAVAAPTFTDLQQIYKLAGNEPKKFWFCPRDDLQCVKSTTCRWVAYYPPIPEKWPIKVGTNLSQEEVFKLESVGFCLKNKVNAADAMVLEAMLEDHHTPVLNDAKVEPGEDVMKVEPGMDVMEEPKSCSLSAQRSQSPAGDYRSTF